MPKLRQPMSDMSQRFAFTPEHRKQPQRGRERSPKPRHCRINTPLTSGCVGARQRRASCSIRRDVVRPEEVSMKSFWSPPRCCYRRSPVRPAPARRCRLHRPPAIPSSCRRGAAMPMCAGTMCRNMAARCGTIATAAACRSAPAAVSRSSATATATCASTAFAACSSGTGMSGSTARCAWSAAVTEPDAARARRA